jgi:L-threonylcarbamoyladenylate synthase
MIPPISEELLEDAHRLLSQGDVVAFPTETVYGLGANAYDQKSVEKIFQIKGRPAHNPLIVHLSALDKLILVTTQKVIDIISPTLDRLAQYIPGALSFVIPKNEQICPAVCAGLETVAVRIPKHDVAKALLKRCPFPIAAPSANPSNYISPTSAEHVHAQLGSLIPLVLDGGPCSVGIESTILDLSGEAPRILRQGIVSAEMLAEALDMSAEDLLMRATSDKDAAIPAPGMLREHYSPNTPLRIVSEPPPANFPVNAGIITMHGFSPLLNRSECEHRRSLSANGDLNQICHNLFKTLREFDSLKLDSIYIESCERIGIGRAIMDRIDRASAKWAFK